MEVIGSSFLRVGYVKVEAFYPPTSSVDSVDGMIMQHWWNHHDKGRPKYSKNLDQCYVVHHKSHTYWSGVTLIMDMKESGGVDWIFLAQDTDKWQASVNTITILRGSLSMRNFFTTLGSIGFSKGTVVHKIDSFGVKIDYNCYATHLTSSFSRQFFYY